MFPRLRLLLIVLLLVWAAPALALWHESYEQAEEALQAGNWAEAIGHLTQAIEDKGDSAVRARTYGMNFTSYFPYYKLGVAYYNLERYDDAMQAFETEIQLGAISGSETDLAELERYRGLIEEVRQQQAAAEAERIRQLVASNMDEASRLEQAGSFAEALAAVDRVLAVAPDDQEAQDARQRLLAEITRVEEQQRLEQAADDLVEQGRSQFDAGDYAEAASTFNQALGMRDDEATRDLLAQAQERLRAEIDDRNRRQAIADGLERATRMEAAGDLVGALDQLQPVLALDPNNQQALELQQRIVTTQTENTRRTQAEEALQSHLAEAAAQVERGEFQQSLVFANRALALEPGNREALGYVTTAYREINRQLLGGGPIENLPPAIRFFDFREERPDGSLVETVADRRFRLRGEVSDATPVEIEIRDPRGEIIEDVRMDHKTDDENLRIITGFSLVYDLRQGESVFRIVATDPEGGTASAEYAVLYSVPFFRSPWPYVATIAVLGAALYAYRRFRRRRLIARRYNPYVTGAPVLKDKLFFGRERLLAHVLQRIHINSVLLYGERRIGKTSFQHRLKRRLESLDDPEYAFYPVYTDLQGTREERFFSTLAEDTFHELGPHLEGLKPHPALQDGSGYDYRAFVSDIRKVIAALKKKNPKKTVRVVLMIDEVDELNNYDPRVNQRLRRLFMKNFAENLVAVVSGVGIKKQWEREGSPWYNFFQEIPVKPFRREDAESLIRVPIQGVFDLDDGVVDEILETTDTKPYQIQKLCAVLVNRMHDEQRTRITVDDVRAVRSQTEA
jgi:tetratricopeptide (TPR) repeat protein